MGWFDEQIKERKRLDDDAFADAMEEISSVITGRKTNSSTFEEKGPTPSQGVLALGQVLRHYHIKPKEVPENITDFSEQMDYLCRPHGVMYRKVHLDGAWFQDAVGVYLGKKKDGQWVALLPNRLRGYRYYDWETGETVKLNHQIAAQLEEDAICFYKPFPMTKLTLPALVRYVLGSVPRASYLSVIALMALSTLVGILFPVITHIIFQEVIPGGSMRAFWAVLVFLVCTGISTQLIGMVKSLVENRVSEQMSIYVQAATIARVLLLPVSFFRRYSAGELTSKIQYFNSLCTTLYSGFIAVGIGSVFSLVYLVQIFSYTPVLVIPSVCMLTAVLGYSMYNTNRRMTFNKRAMEEAGKKNGLTYALLSGIRKIKMAGAEKRVFARWARVYTNEVRYTYGIPNSVLLGSTVTMAITLLGNLAMYYFAVKAEVAVADYYAFTAAYGMVSGAFSALAGIGVQAAKIRSTLELVRPIMEEVPEVADDKLPVTNLSGSVELNHVSFRYDERSPWVLRDISLKIRPGQYIAIVGQTGSGKSTLMRLLLGFETPQRGAVYYDGKNIDTLELQSLRQKIGVVMQDDKLFYGDIFSNIGISVPDLTMEQAWEAAELAGLADEIRAMPMGMKTRLSEGGGGISGGQKQRLMIARAVAAKPKLLLLDEATSALDNLTQKKIADALDRLNCTRIVIAHRLSTIRNCDRILVLENGKIVEDGTYDELIAKSGSFAELVERQRVNG